MRSSRSSASLRGFISDCASPTVEVAAHDITASNVTRQALAVGTGSIPHKDRLFNIRRAYLVVKIGSHHVCVQRRRAKACRDSPVMPRSDVSAASAEDE